MKALLLVDMQMDYYPGGAIGLEGNDLIVEVANQLIPSFPNVVAAIEWHPADHCSFAANHLWRKPGQIIEIAGQPQLLWPMHCVQDSFGALFMPGLEVADIQKVFKKGYHPQVDSYSAFFDNQRQQSTGLDEYLKEMGITALYIIGSDLLYGVKYSAIHAQELGYQTYILLNGCGNTNPDLPEVMATKEILTQAGVQLLS